MKCPLCDCNEARPFLIKGRGVLQFVFGVALLECPRCHFGFADFIHSQTIEYYYEHFCRQGEVKGLADHLRLQAKENGQSQVDTISQTLPPPYGKVLDFGGGNGEAARLYLPLAEEVYVTESDPRSIRKIQEESRLRIIESNQLMDDRYVGYFDLVIFSNVLEHMTHPIRRMNEFSRIIAPDGHLFVEIPNEYEVVKQTGAHANQHISFFSPDTFRLLLDRQGSFDIEDLRTCGAPLADVIANHGLIHAFDKLDTPDGWVIRALLKNSRPEVKLREIPTDVEDMRSSLVNLSQYIHMMASHQTKPLT